VKNLLSFVAARKMPFQHVIKKTEALHM